jgi:hypothetical protein
MKYNYIMTKIIRFFCLAIFHWAGSRPTSAFGGFKLPSSYNRWHSCARRSIKNGCVPLNVASNPVPQSLPKSLDWSFLDATYVITCPNADEGSKRLTQTTSILDQVGINQSVSNVVVEEFETDDEDRVRGCYMSHIAILQAAKKRFMKRDKPCTILVLEDNLATSTAGGAGLTQSMVAEWDAFIGIHSDCDIMQLAYTPYVPNLTVSKTDNSNVKLLTCGVGSALGTSAYIVTSRGINTLLEEHKRAGYVQSIPDVMASLFPNTRYAAYPAPFQRAPRIKSLVNPQLDELREILFQPLVVARAQDLLALTELCTNSLLLVVVVVLLVVSGLAGKTTLDSIVEWTTTGSYQGNAIIPVLSSLFSLFSLGVLGVGAALAPKPAASATTEEGISE